jgi:hypothetical protein
MRGLLRRAERVLGGAAAKPTGRTDSAGVSHAAKTEIGGQVAHDPEKPLYGFPIGARLAQQKGRASG